MNNQEAFTLARDHLLKQCARATNLSGSCRYRAADGTRCAIGVLIPDDEYDSTIEAQSIEEIFDKVPALQDLDVDMLTSLQVVHDEKEIRDWETHLRRVANEHDLIWEVA